MNFRFLAISVGALFIAGTATAQTVSFGTSPQGAANNALSSALGKVTNEQTGLKIRIVPMGGTEQYGPPINDGRMDIAIASSTDVQFAYDGSVTFKGRPQTNLRAIASLYAFQVAFLVPINSKIKTIGDLKGKRVPIKFSNHKAAHRHYLAAISAAGFTENDFDGVPVAHVVTAAKDFVQGKLDVTWFAVGAGKVKEMAAQVGGIRYLPAETSPEALKRMRKYAPAAYIEMAKPRKSAPGIVGVTPVITETYMLFGGKHVSKDVVHKLLDTLHTSKAKLGKAFPRWKRYNPNQLWRKTGIPDHPEAVSWFKANKMAQVK
ncbi:MAG: TAXI family TRAP transporter solute-binding subunit [Rhodospirillaceae bacterium]|jgi:uncharacterized protein|nr:TAXI family TRAP transporter solute-binding subunit [Rhodospirillaceae bacterium]